MVKDNYSDPCLVCHYSTQACTYIVDGFKEDDACATKLSWIRYQRGLKTKDVVDQTKHLRESRHILTQMKVLYFNIENAVFAAELKCPDEFRCEGGSACDFRKNGECIVPKLRKLLGESGSF